MSDVAPRIAPHPRFKQRRVEVKRDEGRRRLRILVGTLLCAATAGAAYGVTRSPLLDVDTVEVRGAVHTANGDVLRASGLDSKPSLLDVDEDDIARAVEALPWVDSAQVTTHFPNRVEVSLMERTPVAAVPVEGPVWATVDDAGRVLEHLPAGPPPELMRIETPRVADAPGSSIDNAVRGAVKVHDALPELLTGRVPTMVVDEQGSLELRLDGKISVLFGPSTQIEQKLLALTTLLTKTDMARVRVIDVRVPTAPVLTRT